MTKKINALVVEDHYINQELIKEILENLNCEVTTAGHGKEALKFIESDTFDIVFMDLQMPEMDGYETTRQIRKISGKMSSVPIVALTASALEQDKRKCFDFGMTDYVTKPYEFKDIENILNKIF